MNILIVDDDPFMLKFLTRALTKNDMDVTCFTHPQDAAQSLKSQTFDLIISDVMMPEVNGVELTFWLQKHAPNTPVILISSVMTEDIKTVGESAGIFAALQKPFDPEDLLSLIYKLENPGITGFTNHLNPIALFEILLLNPKHRVIQVQSQDPQIHYLIFINQSHIIHAEKYLDEVKTAEGQEILEEVLKLKTGMFSSMGWQHVKNPTIQQPFQNIVMDLMTQEDEKRNSQYRQVYKQMLIFENNKEDMAQIQNTLNTFKYKLKYADNLDNALELLKTEDFDFVLQNLELKNMETTTLFKHLLTHYPHIQVGFMSHELKDLKAQLQDDEDIMIFQKPLNLDVFKTHMASTINMGLSGTLKDISVFDLLQLNLRNQGERKRLEINDRVRDTQGTLYFEWGALVHAEYEDLSGEAALGEILNIKQGHFHDEKWEPPTEKTLVGTSPQKLMIKVLSGQTKSRLAPEVMASIEARLKMI